MASKYENDIIYKQQLQQQKQQQQQQQSNYLNEKTQLKEQIELLIETYLNKTSLKSTPNSSLASSNSSNTTSTAYDEVFLENLFELIYQTKYKEQFSKLYDEINKNQLKRNLFACTTKVANELFNVGLYDSSQCLLEFIINSIDTSSLMLKMSALSNLSACYWKQSKFNESIRCMNLELNLVSHLNDPYNKYRILGNIAYAYQLLSNIEEANNHFKLQFNVSIKLKDRLLTAYSLNAQGNLNMKCKDYSKALICYEKSLSLIELYPHEIADTKKLLIKQYSLIGECCIKLNNINKARDSFYKQLQIAHNLVEIDSTNDDNYLEICKAQLNLALIDTKSNMHSKSVKLYEMTVDYLIKNCNIRNIKALELYFKLNTCLINTHLKCNNVRKAAIQAQYLLDFCLKEQQKSQLLPHVQQKYEKYLRYIELSACSKLASCYAKEGYLVDALKLYYRVAKLAKQTNNVIYLTRSYSHLAQIYFLEQEYDKCIEFYKEILGLIEHDRKTKLEINKKTNINVSSSNSSTAIYNNFDRRLTHMSYYTYSNLGLCMEMVNNKKEAYNLFLEQYNLSKTLDNTKYCANALLNLINLYFGNLKHQNSKYDLNGTLFNEFQIKKENELYSSDQLQTYLYNLLDIYQELNDLIGELFASQYLAYYYHSNNYIKIAIKFYLHSIELCKLIKKPNNNSLEKSLFNLSICYRLRRKYKEAYKYQIEYLCLVKVRKSSYCEFISLGIIADLLLEMNSNYDDCIKIHVNRLKLIQECLRNANAQQATFLSTLTVDEIEYFTTKRCKLIADCLSSIAKCYFLFKDYQQVFKFKLMELKLRIQDEQISSNDNLDLDENRIGYEKQKFKILLDLGNLLLFKMNNYTQSIQYFERALEITTQLNDLLLQSLALGNLGICKLKNSEYEIAINYFQQQITVLNKKLILLDANSPNANPSINKEQSLNRSKISKYKEIVTINLDKGRSYSKLSKCYELLDKANSSVSMLFQDDVLHCLLEYVKICETLYDKYICLHEKLNMSDSSNVEADKNSDTNSDETDVSEMNYLIKETCEQIIKDYDASLHKLAKFYTQRTHVNPNNSQTLYNRAIELQEKRLDLLVKHSNLIDSNSYKLQSKIQITYLISNLYFKQNMIDLCFDYTKQIIDIYETTNDFELLAVNTNKILYVQTLILYFKIINLKDNEHKYLDNKNMVKYALASYETIWSLNISSEFNEKILQLKYQSTYYLAQIYLKLEMYPKCIETLIDSVKRFSNEFSEYQLKMNNDEIMPELNETKKNYSKHFMEFLHKINFKIAITQIEYEDLKLNSVPLLKSVNNDSDDSSVDTLELRERKLQAASLYLNEAEKFLNFEREFLVDNLYKLRQAKIYYYKGRLHKQLKQFELGLEMFASSLDIYEILRNNEINNLNDLSLHEIDESYVAFNQNNEVIDKAIDDIYEYIKDTLIKLDRLKEALLVSERHRAKSYTYLNNLQELYSFDQIESLVIHRNPLAIIYFDLLKHNSTLNVWCIQPNFGITKFHQISYKSLNTLLLADENENKTGKDFNFFEDIQRFHVDTQNVLLTQAYNLLIRPFEENLLSWVTDEVYDENEAEDTKSFQKPKIYVIYDENLFTIPFHFLRTKLKRTERECYLYELFQINTMFSLRYLLKPMVPPQNIFDTTKSEVVKVVSSENELKELIENRTPFQIKLLILKLTERINDITTFHLMVNHVLSDRIAYSVLIMMNNNSNYDERIKYLHTTCLSIIDNLDDTVKFKEIDSIYSETINNYRKKYINELPYCYFLGRNVNLTVRSKVEQSDFTSLDEEIEMDETENAYFYNLIWQIIKLNAKTVNSSLIMLLTFMLKSYLDQSDLSTKIGTTIENVEKRLNLTAENKDNLVPFKSLFRLLGFVFDKNLIKFPSDKLYKKLEIMNNCLSNIQTIPSNILNQLSKLSQKSGKELLKILIQQDAKRRKNMVALKINSKQSEMLKSLLNEFMKPVKLTDSEFIVAEIDINLHKIIYFLCQILFNGTYKNVTKYIQTYLDSISTTSASSVRNEEREDDFDDNSSQYSSLSSILGLQSKLANLNQPVPLDITMRLLKNNIYQRIEDFDDGWYSPKSSVDEINKATQYANNLHKMIEINVDTESEIAVYDRYLNTLLDNDLKYNGKQLAIENKFEDFENTADNDEYKWKCLLFYEEEEKIRKMITTVTTRTITEDSLECKDLLRNRLILHDSVADDLDETVDFDCEKEMRENSQNNMMTTKMNGNISKNATDDGIYSNLENYSSNVLVENNNLIDLIYLDNQNIDNTNNNINENDEENFNNNNSNNNMNLHNNENDDVTEVVLLASISSSERNDSGFYSHHNSMKQLRSSNEDN